MIPFASTLLPLLMMSSLVIAADVDPAVVQKLRASTFRVDSFFGDRPLGIGTAFAVGNATTVVSALHVIQYATRLTMTNLSTGKVHTLARIESIDRRLDAVRLRINEPSPAFLDPESGAYDQGKSVVIYGNPAGLNASLAIGIIASVDPDRFGLIQINAALSPGNSGGPVTGYDGKVMGIASSKMVGRAIEGLTFASPVRRILSAPNIDLPLVSASILMLPDYLDWLSGRPDGRPVLDLLCTLTELRLTGVHATEQAPVP